LLSLFFSHTVHYVADHWENFNQVYEAALAESSILQRLHIELDHLCHRAVQHILAAQRSLFLKSFVAYCNHVLHCRLGSWQFLTDLPYWCISLDMMWRLLWLMHQGHHSTVDPNDSPQTQVKGGKALNYCRMLLEGEC
jgi:hypothetical protein